MSYKCPRKYKNDLARRYNMTPRVYEAIKVGQGNKCAICQQYSERLNLDHCHTTGRNRGFTCHNCNALLGFAKDDPEILEAAAKYLRES